MARSLSLAMFVVLGCKLDNPAFEDGDGVADDSTSKDSGSEAPGESGTSVGESSSDDPSSSSTSATDDPSSSSTDDPSSSSSTDDPTSSSTDGFTSSDTSDSFTTEGTSSESTGDTDLQMCPIPLFVIDCPSCLQTACCPEFSDLLCINGKDDACHCHLLCLLDPNNPCQCPVDPDKSAQAQAIFDCGQDQCLDFCVL